MNLSIKEQRPADLQRLVKELIDLRGRSSGDDKRIVRRALIEIERMNRDLVETAENLDDICIVDSDDQLRGSLRRLRRSLGRYSPWDLVDRLSPRLLDDRERRETDDNNGSDKSSE